MNIKQQNGAVIIELKGKLVAGPLAGRMERTLNNILAQGEKHIIFDLGSVTHLDSSGMGILLSGFTKVNDKGGKLKLANITAKIRNLLSITKLNSIFEVYDSVEDAIKSFNHQKI